jgi:AcrR family transcriptional regulator
LAAGEKRDDLVQKRREQIIAAARKIFAQKGYRCTRTEEIAAALGVGKGTLYRYFRDKKELFLGVNEEGLQRLSATAKQVFSIADPRERLKAVVKTFCEFFDCNRDLIEIGMQMRSDFREEYERQFVTGHSQHIGDLEELLQEGTRRGCFCNIDPVMGARALSALLYGTLLQFYYRRTGGRLTDYAQPIIDLVMLGLLRRPEDASRSE